MIIRYGLIAVLLGAGIEGEPFAIAGGILAERHLLNIWAAGGAAFAGSCLIDQAWFHLARGVRTNRWIEGVTRRPAFARSLALLDRHPTWFVLLFRFAYGLRAVAPVAIGFSRIRTALFVPLNLLAAAVWSILFTALGYLVGPAFEHLSKRFGIAATVAAAVVSVAALALTLRRGRKDGGEVPPKRHLP